MCIRDSGYLSELESKENYLCLKFEDLFGGNIEHEKFRSLREFLNLEKTVSLEKEDFSFSARNKSENLYSSDDIKDTVVRYKGRLKPLMNKYNYDFLNV